MMRKSRAAAFRVALRLLADDRSSHGAPGKSRRFSSSVKHALRGILFTFMKERNFRFESAAAAFAVAMGVLLGIDRLEWAILLLNIFLVLALEAKNTSLEMTTNIATREYHYGAKSSKDVSSGAVLLAAVSSVVSGLLIFGPRLLTLALKIVSYLHIY